MVTLGAPTLAANTESRLVSEARSVLQEIRRALIELYASIGADPEEPQEVARRLDISRSLTWRLSRAINAAEPFSILNHLPGQQGLEVALRSFEVAGAPHSAVEQVERAVAALGTLIAHHADDRGQFELALESMGLFQPEHRVESGRELAFRGNSMIWGVQARTRLMTSFLAPSQADRSKTEIVQVSGLFGFRRLRPTVRWRLFRLQLHDDKGADVLGKLGGPEEIEPNKAPGDTPMLFREFCSESLPKLETMDGPDGREFFLPRGEVGNTGSLDCVSGIVLRGLPAYSNPSNPTASVAAQIALPVEKLVMDVILHRDVEMGSSPEVLIYGYPHGGADSPSSQTVENQLPIPLALTELAGSPPALATPLVPRYTPMAQRIFTRMGWSPVEFRGLRVQLDFPPMSSRAVIRWALPPAP